MRGVSHGDATTARELLLTSSLILIVAACGGADGERGAAPATLAATTTTTAAATTTTTAAATTTTTAAASAWPLVGEWRRTRRCEEVLEILTKAGFSKQVALNTLTEEGFLPGVPSADQIADPKQPCNGAVPDVHSHFSPPMGSSVQKTRRVIRLMTDLQDP
jgi:hypothetical protein